MTTQQRTALDLANHRRTAQAEFKRALRTKSIGEGKRAAIDAVRDPGPDLAAMRLEALLKSIHKVGDGKAMAICRMSNVRPTRRLGDLVPHERLRLELILGR